MTLTQLLGVGLIGPKGDMGEIKPKPRFPLGKETTYVTGDLFSGKPLIYRPRENGYLLYSVGANGRDEKGRSYEDQPPGDDLVVRMPLPKKWNLKQKDRN